MADETTTGATPENTNERTEDQQEETPAGLTEAGKDALRKEREARRAAEKERKSLAERLAELERKQQEADEQKRKDEEAAAAKRGEFEQLANQRAESLKTVTGERDALAERVKSYEARDRQRIDAGVTDLPEDLVAFDPGPDAPLDQRLAWFEKASEIAGKRAATTVRTPVTPQPNGKAKPDIKPLVHASSA